MPIFYPQTNSLLSQEAIAYAVRRIHPHGLTIRPRCTWPVRRDYPILAYDLEQALSYLLTTPGRHQRTVSDCRRAGHHYTLHLPADPVDLHRRIVALTLCVGHAQYLCHCPDDYPVLLLASSR